MENIKLNKKRIEYYVLLIRYSFSIGILKTKLCNAK